MHKSFLRLLSLSIVAAFMLAACADMPVEDTGTASGTDPAASQPEGRTAELAAAESAPPQTVRQSNPTSVPKALRGLPSYAYGDGVDWVKALQTGKIAPHATASGGGDMSVMDADVPIVVKGTMANVVFPHKAHTEWLACTNCHVGLYQMARGVNSVGMVKITQGESCGVCHGTVAFPVDDCLRCHSQPKKVAAP